MRRAESVCVGDTDPFDAFDPSVQWEQFDQDTFDWLGSHSNDCATCPGEPEVWLNEFSASTTGTDVEYLEIFGDPLTDYSDLAILAVEGHTVVATLLVGGGLR